MHNSAMTALQALPRLLRGLSNQTNVCGCRAEMPGLAVPQNAAEIPSISAVGDAACFRGMGPAEAQKRQESSPAQQLRRLAGRGLVRLRAWWMKPDGWRVRPTAPARNALATNTNTHMPTSMQDAGCTACMPRASFASSAPSQSTYCQTTKTDIFSLAACFSTICDHY